MAKKKTTKKNPRLWLTRDAAHDGRYRVFIGSPPEEGRFSEWRAGKGGGTVLLLPGEFEQAFDPSLRLEPGGGPIRVRLVREEDA